MEPDKRWTDLPVKHELYCAGHLFEAAVAYAELRGKPKLLEVARRMADHIDRIFGQGKRIGYAGHPEIELALFKLWRHTGEQRYFDLVRFFIDARGATPAADYMQAHKPIREQSVVVGHAVRATYLFAGVADLAMTTGEGALVDALDRLWGNLALKRMYLTGGIGPSASNEGFTRDYDLPNRTSYAETCAGIGFAFWNYRMGLLHGDARYADVLERGLYNGILSGVSIDGRRFFYVNPLQGTREHARAEWFGCACCPPNILRTVPQVGTFAYAVAPDGIAVNLYLGSKLSVELGGATVILVQETNYPWDGAVRFRVAEPGPGAFTLWLRRPDWAAAGAVQITVNGAAPDTTPQLERGYLSLRQTWKKGDRVDLTLPMAVRRTVAHPAVEANRARVALERGPIVYCLESVDNDFDLRFFCLPPSAPVAASHRDDLLGGVTVLRGTGELPSFASWRGKLYQSAPAPRPVSFTAIPYALWCNRGPADMVVWVPQAAALQNLGLAASAAVSASRCHGDLAALNDGIEPANSGDYQIPRHTFWSHKGTAEWVMYEFPEAASVEAAAVYWFDDTGRGECRVPESWRLLWRDGESWKPVDARGPYETAKDAWNRVEFGPVTTKALKLEVKLQKDVSGGILEWRLEE
jgi:hypothetical protein